MAQIRGMRCIRGPFSQPQLIFRIRAAIPRIIKFPKRANTQTTIPYNRFLQLQSRPFPRKMDSLQRKIERNRSFFTLNSSEKSTRQKKVSAEYTSEVLSISVNSRTYKSVKIAGFRSFVCFKTRSGFLEKKILERFASEILSTYVNKSVEMTGFRLSVCLAIPFIFHLKHLLTSLIDQTISKRSKIYRHNFSIVVF